MFSSSGNLRRVTVRGIRILLSTFIVWWTAVYWYPSFGLISAILAGVVLAAFAEAPLSRTSDIRNQKIDPHRRN